MLLLLLLPLAHSLQLLLLVCSQFVAFAPVFHLPEQLLLDMMQA
jgi:hypothetical protein